MSRTLLLLVAAVLVAVVAADRKHGELWTDYKIQHGLELDGADDEQRYAIFENNVAQISSLNAERNGAKFGLTGLSHLSEDEFHGLLGSRTPPHKPAHQKRSVLEEMAVESLPSSKDWCGQGGCG